MNYFLDFNYYWHQNNRKISAKKIFAKKILVKR